MTHLEPEDILRRVLYAAAESVQPAPDGLAKIHARLSAPRPLTVARLMAAWETLGQLVVLRLEFVMIRLEPARAALVNWLDTVLPAAHRRLRLAVGRLRPLTERLRPALAWLISALERLGHAVQPRTGPEGRPVRHPWTRSVIAMAAVVLVAIGSGVTLSVVPRQIVQIAQDAQSALSGQSQGSSGGSHARGVNSDGAGNRPAPGANGQNGASPSPTSSCKPNAKPKAHPSPTRTPTPPPTTPPPTTPPPTTPPPTTPPPTTPPPTTPPPTTPPPGSGPEQGTSSASATQSAQDSTVVIIGSAATPTPCASGHG
jgi:hypothetical protein